MSDLTSTLRWIRDTLHPPQDDQPADINIWRSWLLNALSILLALIVFPLTYIFTLPVFLAGGHYVLIGIDSVFMLLALWHIIHKGAGFTAHPGVWVFALYVMTFCFFYYLGPGYARSGWLVLCTVIMAIFFRRRLAVLASFTTLVALLALYPISCSGNPAWAEAVEKGWMHYLTFAINISMLCLGAALPVGFLLSRLGRALEAERAANSLLTEERNALTDAKESLEDEIKERRRVEAALVTRERQYREIFSSAKDAIFIHDAVSGAILEVNQTMLDIYGYSADEVRGLTIANLSGEAPEYSVQAVHARIHQAVEEGPQTFEWMARTKSGTEVPVEIELKHAQIAGKHCVIAVVRDITRRREAERNAMDEKMFSERLLNSLPGIFFLFDPQGNMMRSNKQYQQLIGITEAKMVNRSLLQDIHADDHDKVSAAVRQVMESGSAQVSARLVVKGGDVLDYLFTGARLDRPEGPYMIGVGIDISALIKAQTEKTQLEEQLRRIQKIEAIGTLAGGIAHDFNNILGGIMGFSELAQVQLPDGAGEAAYSLSRVLEACQRARDLVLQILHFSRQGDTEKRPLVIAVVVKEACKLMRASTPSNIDIRQYIKASAAQTMADASQIHQVVMNLCTNAGHAMRRKEGTLTVTLEEVDFNDDADCRECRLDPGRYIRLRITDTGCGMTPEIQERIFDPYFTTKGEDEGTGLGMSVTLGIVRSHGGDITVKSRLGEGTTVDVYFPSIETVDVQDAAHRITVVGGSERILFVDDEVFYKELIMEMLGGLGYQITAESVSLDALARFENGPGDFDIVITDQTMPKMTGLELARHIHKRRPELPVIVCTGFSESITPENATAAGIGRVLMKPVRRQDLANSIRELLDPRKDY